MDKMNFQKMAKVQGAAFAKESLLALELAGFEIADTEVYISDVGITLDAVTNNKQGVAMAWEFKGSLQGSRAGLKRTDTMKKALANAVLLSLSDNYAGVFPPMCIMTSHIPTINDSERMMRTALEKGKLLAVVDSRDGKELQKLANMTEDAIRRKINGG